jgi:putative tricarboxylic transport membrane protein
MKKASLRQTAAVLAAMAMAAAGCGGGTDGGSSGDFEPGPTEFVVHTGPGGGSDVFAREVTALLEQESLVARSSWTVRNESGGSGAAAMAYLARLSGETGTVALTTPTWITTPLTTPEAAVTLDQLTPIAQLITEPLVMAVRADAPYQRLEDFIAAAQREPGGLVQAGGSVTSVDAIAGEIIQEATGTDWSYLSFEGGGERITAVLSGDADAMFGSPADFAEQSRAGALRVIATIGDQAPALFPDAPTLADAGLDIEVPQQLRGVVGPPEMPQEAVAHYEGLFQRLTQTEAWKAYTAENGLTTVFAGGAEFGANNQQQTDLLRTRLESLGLLTAK